MEVFAKSSHPLSPGKYALYMQGTLYPDVIESMPPPGKDQKHSHMIKSHHNVGGLPKDLEFTLIEPLRELFKVRPHACLHLTCIYKRSLCRQVAIVCPWGLEGSFRSG